MCNIISNAAQHTLDWFRARLGCITGSNVGLIINSGKGKDKNFTDTAERYLYGVAGDRTLNPSVVQNDELFNEYLNLCNTITKPIKWGTEQEPNARALYVAKTGIQMVEVGCCRHPSIPYFASSPDGFHYNEDNGEKICLEIKCLGQNEYMKYLHRVSDGETLLKVNPTYFYQCHAHMMVTGAVATDFVIYNPFQDIPIRIIRIPRNDDISTLIGERVRLGNEFIDDVIKNRKRHRTA